MKNYSGRERGKSRGGNTEEAQEVFGKEKQNLFTHIREDANLTG